MKNSTTKITKPMWKVIRALPPESRDRVIVTLSGGYRPHRPLLTLSELRYCKLEAIDPAEFLKRKLA